MRKRSALVVAAVAALGLFGSMGWATTYPSSPCTDGVPAETHGSNETNVTNPATGGHVYVMKPGESSTSEYAGTHGSTGYVEAYFDAATGTGTIEGQTADGRVAASVYGGRNGKTAGACVGVMGTTVDEGV